MQKIITELSSPVWWFSVVVAGLLVNLVAAYAKPILDRIAAKYSRARRERVVDAQHRLDRAVDYLLANPHELTDLKLDTIRTILNAILISVSAVLLTQMVDAVAPFLPLKWFVAKLFALAVYCVATVVLMVLIREYLTLRSLLVAYNQAAHTAVSRYKNDQYPTA